MSDTILSVSDFTKYPGGRKKKDGPYSGEEFRDNFLKPALLAAKAARSKVIVNLDGVAGYGSSFLEEVFGGIVRLKVLPPDEIAPLMSVRVTDDALAGFRADALRYLTKAIAEAKAT